MTYNKETLYTIRWKLDNGYLLNAGESAYLYAMIGDVLGYPNEDMQELAVEANQESTEDLVGKNVCLVVGHEPGGGAQGERAYNIEVAKEMKILLEARGAKVLIYYHRTKSYPARTWEMRASIKKHMSNVDVVILLHYNGVSYPSAKGHEFHYGGYKALAESFRDEWQKDYPDSTPRQDNGILKNTNGRGSLMIKRAPAPCVLTEPFFISNPLEKEKFYGKPKMVAKTYSNSTANFLLK